MGVDKDHRLCLIFIFQDSAHHALACRYLPYKGIKNGIVRGRAIG